MILMIDNYDSFTWNLVQYLSELDDVRTFRNDRITLSKIKAMNPSHIVISPGPGTPEEAGVSMEVIRVFMGRIPIMGVCLGHQAIGCAMGGRLVRAAKPCHGKTSSIYHNRKGIFYGLPTPFKATRYHSLVLEENSLPKELTVTARADDGTVMGLQHLSLPLFGVQFHPESILTEGGMRIIRNFYHTKPAGKELGHQC
ncbi:glutamine amidotransferase of anthranilate synthase or aminodeoxychorismate synthase [Thermanaerovibrio velox DSM 12556]|uniref:Glutamine amidotransferase of anthranilate synthase or aminodeoxychorismate synthase n=1 Tax=Thermanaerovibrio velox DSM 12556 TaxID=926567 RepID=H0UP96_9BACT|nr:aminodeoxychorismate/anthranilate synthase component II [Thermanaerovibrio velox]EHM09509.1 glutamine amidotransferase of anthranilate synthase or aminodeoxychorismate synthase [Thermanaerovibrio velox DSM 12556]